MDFLRSCTIYPASLIANLRSALTLRWPFFLRAACMFLQNLIFFAMWLVLFRQTNSIRSWQQSDILLLIGILALTCGTGCTFFGGFLNIPNFVRSGGLDTYLIRPKNALLLILTSRSEVQAVGDIITGVLFIIMSGSAEWYKLGFMIPAALASMVIFLSISTIFFCLPLWLNTSEDTSRRIWDMLILISSYPDSIFPTGVRFISYTILPAAFVGFLPVYIVRESDTQLLLLLLCVAVGSCWLANFLFKKGLSNYESGNLFSAHGGV